MRERPTRVYFTATQRTAALPGGRGSPRAANLLHLPGWLAQHGTRQTEPDSGASAVARRQLGRHGEVSTGRFVGMAEGSLQCMLKAPRVASCPHTQHGHRFRPTPAPYGARHRQVVADAPRREP